MKDKISILVSSCDKYADLWPLFSYFFNKNWPDCELNKYLISNSNSSNIDGFEQLNIGADLGWSSNLIKSLKHIKTPYVLMLLDDVFIKSRVDNLLFNNICKEFIESEGNYLKFLTHPKSNKKSHSIYFNILPKGSLYRSTSVFALWNKETLVKLLKEDENAWEFELEGAKRSDQFDQFYVVRKNFFQYIHSVVRGNFLHSAYKQIKNESSDLLNLVDRHIASPFFEYKQIIKHIRHKIFYFLVPIKKRRRVREFLKK